MAKRFNRVSSKWPIAAAVMAVSIAGCQANHEPWVGSWDLSKAEVEHVLTEVSGADGDAFGIRSVVEKYMHHDFMMVISSDGTVEVSGDLDGDHETEQGRWVERQGAVTLTLGAGKPAASGMAVSVRGGRLQLKDSRGDVMTLTRH